MNLKNSFVLCTVALLLFGLASVACAQESGEETGDDMAMSAEAPSMETNRQKASYAIGLNLGRNMGQQGVDLDMDLLMDGIRDGFQGNEPPIPDSELQSATQAFQQEVMAAQQEMRQQQAAENIEKAESFLEENAQREGVQVTDSGLQYEVLEEGTGESPAADDRVQVHYKGTLIDGTVFDSSYERGQPATFPLNGVIQGFAEGIQLMQVGDKYKLFIPPALGYGEQGGGQTIPPNAALIFEVELLDVMEAQAPAAPQGGEDDAMEDDMEGDMEGEMEGDMEGGGR